MLENFLGAIYILNIAFCSGDTATDNADVLPPVTRMSTSEEEAETICPDNCRCSIDLPAITRTFNNQQFQTRMNIVNCTSRSLLSVPINIPFDTEVLFLNDNNILTLRKFPNMSNLKYLDVSDNNIQTMEKNIFVGMNNLKYLSLRNNPLKRLWSGSFSGLLKLDHLDISENNISIIPTNTFRELNHLKILELQNNRLVDLNSEWFEDMADISILKLSHNMLTHIRDNVFNVLHNLSSLKLSNNKIQTIDANAFSKLHGLRIIDLSNNFLTRVPTQLLQNIASISNVLLDGNQIKKIKTGDFVAMNFTSLSLSYMENLLLVDKHAFKDLPSLVRLQLHDNPHLMYIDHNALHNVPKLKRLYVHNNQITEFSSDILDHAPSLSELHLYNNPLRCDCNALWIKEISNIATNYSKGLFYNSKSVTCDFPLNVTGEAIEDVDEDIFGRVCAPTTVQLFKEGYSLNFGGELKLECHAFGVPTPTIQWTFPNGTFIDTNVNSEKVSIIDDCLLVIHHLTTSDSGTYSCIADNGQGYDLGSTYIHVRDRSVRLIPETVASGYISISLLWNETNHNATATSNYQVKYSQITKPDEPVDRKTYAVPKIISIRSQDNSYSVTNLQPNTMYEFCILHMEQTENYTVDCINITTLAKPDNTITVRSNNVNTIVVLLCTTLAITLMSVCLMMVIRKIRYRNRKYYATAYEEEEVEPVNIQMETIYPSLTVPLYTSRTTLLDAHGEDRDMS